LLHVTNGVSAAQGIRDAGIPGDVLCWNDILHEGPLPATTDEREFAASRARFIAGCGLGRHAEIRDEFDRRDARLVEARHEDEVVLWFEHDLYDQLQLVQVLARLAPRVRRPRRLSQVASNRYLGTLPANWFTTEFAYRDPVTDATCLEAVHAWQALTSDDPKRLDGARASFLELPFLAQAVTRHLQEFPAVASGLSRFESQLLRVLSDGPQDLVTAYYASHHDAEESIFLGDTVFAWHVSRLSQGDDALIRGLDGRPIAMPGELSPEHWEQRVLLTPLAERIVSGAVDRVAVAGVDRWLGGVHLHGHYVPWRWDERQGRLVSS
jgi:hypothetical protein